MLETVRQRRSVRRYLAQGIDTELVEQLQDAVLRSPSSRNLQPWRFVFVTEPGLLGELSRAKASFGEFLAGAPLGIVVSADETVSDCWVEDCSIAATVLQLSATELGLGSCWIQIRGRADADGRSAEERVRELLDLDENMRVLSILAVGYPAQNPGPKPKDTLAWDRIEVRAPAIADSENLG